MNKLLEHLWVRLNIFMEHFERNALANSVYVPKIWKRYVDDIFAIWPHRKEHLDTFLSYFKNIHPAIKFTIQNEDDQHFPLFLDIALTLTSNGTLNHGVYRLPTLTVILTILFITLQLNLPLVKCWLAVHIMLVTRRAGPHQIGITA